MATGGDGVGEIERDSPRSTDELRKMIREEIAAALHPGITPAAGPTSERGKLKRPRTGLPCSPLCRLVLTPRLPGTPFALPWRVARHPSHSYGGTPGRQKAAGISPQPARTGTQHHIHTRTPPLLLQPPLRHQDVRHATSRLLAAGVSPGW